MYKFTCGKYDFTCIFVRISYNFTWTFVQARGCAPRWQLGAAPALRSISASDEVARESGRAKARPAAARDSGSARGLQRSSAGAA